MNAEILNGLRVEVDGNAGRRAKRDDPEEVRRRRAERAGDDACLVLSEVADADWQMAQAALGRIRCLCRGERGAEQQSRES